jgi:hypothetical protein
MRDTYVCAILLGTAAYAWGCVTGHQSSIRKGSIFDPNSSRDTSVRQIKSNGAGDISWGLIEVRKGSVVEIAERISIDDASDQISIKGLPSGVSYYLRWRNKRRIHAGMRHARKESMEWPLLAARQSTSHLPVQPIRNHITAMGDIYYDQFSEDTTGYRSRTVAEVLSRCCNKYRNPSPAIDCQRFATNSGVLNTDPWARSDSHLIQLPLHYAPLSVHRLPLSIREIAINTKGDEGHNFKNKRQPFQGTMLTKRSSEPVGCALLMFGAITALIGMGCFCLWLPRISTDRGLFGCIVCGVFFLLATIFLIHRGLDIVFRDSSAYAPVRLDYQARGDAFVAVHTLWSSSAFSIAPTAAHSRQ